MFQQTTRQNCVIFVPVSNVPESCSTKTFAYEFRHDSLRARYMSRQLDPDTFAAVSPEQWHDCDGDMIYRDWTWDGDDVELGTFHLPGIGRVTSPAAGEEPIYVHTDHLGTTRLITDNTETGGNPDPQVIYTAIFTAFGELVDPTGQGEVLTETTDRYGYVGTHGYQTHTWHDDDDAWFPFVHMGARYYDPSTGRFLQRDPIGILGGLNVYAYVHNSPPQSVDPTGLVTSGDIFAVAVAMEAVAASIAVWSGGTGGPVAGSVAIAGGVVGGLGAVVYAIENRNRIYNFFAWACNTAASVATYPVAVLFDVGISAMVPSEGFGGPEITMGPQQSLSAASDEREFLAHHHFPSIGK